MCDCLAQQCERKGGEETGRGRETKSVVSPANSLTPHATNSACAQIIVSCLWCLLCAGKEEESKDVSLLCPKLKLKRCLQSAAALKTHQPPCPAHVTLQSDCPPCIVVPNVLALHAAALSFPFPFSAQLVVSRF